MSKFSSSICVIASSIATRIHCVTNLLTGIIGEEEEEEEEEGEEEKGEEEEVDDDELPMTFSAEDTSTMVVAHETVSGFLAEALVAMLAEDLELVGMVFVFFVIGEAAAEPLAVALVANSTSLATCSLSLP